MSNIKISELTEATEANENDLLMIIQNGENKKIKASKVGTGQAGGGSDIQIIQSIKDATTDNVYSAVAVDNKLKTNIVTGQEVATNYYEDGKRVYIMKIQLNGETATKKDEYIKTAISGLSNVRVIDIRGTAIHPNGATAILPSSNPSNCLSINYHKSNNTTENAIEIFCNTISWADYTLEFKIYYTKN